MPSVISFIGSTLVTIGSAVGAGAASAGVAMAVGAATVVAGAVAAQKLISELYGIPSLDSDRSRQATVKGTVEPQKLIYGEALVSGPISFVGVAGEKNRDLYHSIVLAGHPCDSISDIYFDDERIASSSIAGNGNVTSGTFGPKNNNTICVIRKLTGSQTTADSVLDAAFSTINSSEHIGTNLTYIVTKFTLIKKSQDVWDKFLPNDIKALVKGKKVYDPRQDSTSAYYDASVGVSTQRSNNSATWTWSENPVWCLVDYLTDDRFGMDIDLNRIDLSKAVDAADICDATVSVPGGSEKRYTCNGVIFGTATHKVNINKILSSMNGMLTYTNGKYVIRAGAFEAVGAGMTLTEDHMIAPVKLKTSFERNERFNTITGTFVDPSNNYKEIEFPKVQITSSLSRDNNEELRRELKLSMTNSSYMAQRIAHKLIQLSDLQRVLTFPTNLAGINIAVGDRVNVTLSEFGYSNKTFVCIGWTLSESGSGGVNLTLREDDSASYADMAVSSYSTVTAAGGIQQGFFGVPDPSALSATAHVESIELDWINPDNMTGIIAIEVFASPDSSWSNAVKIGETLGTQFIHDESNGIDPIVEGDQRYYWVRARRFPDGEGTDAVSDRNPDSDTSTVEATKGALGALANLDSVGDAQIDDNAVGADQANIPSLDGALGSEFPVNGLAHYWPCNSVQGDILVDVVGGVNATQVTAGGATISTDSPTGKSFTNGASNGFTLLNDTQADAIQTSNGFAWSIWFKSESTTGPAAGRIITRDFSDNWGVRIYQNESPNQTIRFFGEPDEEDVTPTVAQGEWHHVCIVEDGNGEMFGYINGEKVTSALEYTPTTAARPVVIGCAAEDAATGGNAFKGKLTEVRAYNRALTDVEVRALYRMPSGSMPQQVDGGLIVDSTISDDQVLSLDGVLTTITNLQANNIVGDVSEHFSFALGQGFGATSMISLSSTKQTFDVEIPAPSGGVAKRPYIQGVAIADTNDVVGFEFTLEIRLKAGKSYTHDFTGYDRSASAPYGTSNINYNIYDGNQITDLALGGVWTDYANNVTSVHGFFYDDSADETYLLFNDDEGDFQNGDWALTPGTSTSAASNLCLPRFGAGANGEEHTVPFYIILPETTVATTFMITFTGSGFLRGLNGEAGYMR